MLATTEQLTALVNLFHTGTELSYKKGEFVIRPGETPSGVFYISEGLVKAYDITKYGEENMLIIRKEHEIFPLIWAITGQERNVMYETLAPTRVFRITRDCLLEYLHSHSDATPPMLDMAIEMYRIHSERIINLEYRTVRERLVSFLLTMSGRFGKQNANGLIIDVPLRQQDIASSINASRETTSRELTALERKQLLKFEQPHITLLDEAGLRAML